MLISPATTATETVHAASSSLTGFEPMRTRGPKPQLFTPTHIMIKWLWRSDVDGTFRWRFDVAEVRGPWRNPLTLSHGEVRFGPSDHDTPEWVLEFVEANWPTSSLVTPDRYSELEPFGPTDAGDVGGDIARGTAYRRRFARKDPGIPEGGWLVIDATFYPAVEDVNEDSDSPPTLIIREDIFIRCTELGDIGTSEWYRDSTFWRIRTDRHSQPIKATSETAKRLCAEVSPDGFVWNGEHITHELG